MPYEEADRLKFYPKDQPMVLYCDRGGASLSVARDLAEKGFRTRSVIGGMKTYKGKNLVFSQK